MTINPYLLHVQAELHAEHRPKKRYYSAKLVKRLLISADRNLEQLFAPTSGSKPKLIHITPLYTREQGKTRTITYTNQVTSGTYHFYLGAVEEELDPYRAITLLESMPERITFSNTLYHVNRVEIETVDIEAETTEALTRIHLEGKLKLVFASPTVLRDPLVLLKHKTLVPSTMNIFSTPVYIRLYLSGQLRRATLMRTLLRLHRSLSVPPTFWQTLRKKDLHYEPGRQVPTLIGYVNLHYNPENDREATTLQTLRKILPIMLSLGTGVGRAAGLGHITLRQT